MSIVNNFKNEFILSLSQLNKIIGSLIFAITLLLIFAFGAKSFDNIQDFIVAIIAIITFISVVYSESLRCGKEVESGFYQQLNLSENNLKDFLLARISFGFLITLLICFVAIIFAQIFFDYLFAWQNYLCFTLFCLQIYIIALAFCLLTNLSENSNIIAILLSFPVVIPVIIFLNNFSFLHLLGLFFIYTPILLVVIRNAIRMA